MTNQNSQRKRLYVFDSEDVRFSVVHTTLREAKKALWEDGNVQDYCGEYILLSVSWLRGVDVSDIAIGETLDSIQGLERGVYGWIDDDCPLCGKGGRLAVSADWNIICCGDCDERLYQEFLVALNTRCDVHPAIGGAE